MTIADISIASSLTMPTLLNITYDDYPRIQNWLKRVHELPEWQSVDEKFSDLRIEIQKKLKSDGKLWILLISETEIYMQVQNKWMNKLKISFKQISNCPELSFRPFERIKMSILILFLNPISMIFLAELIDRYPKFS